jgi:CRP-like cAMP-binding protein
LGKGDVFGEMSLMTGSPRVASVIARTDVECYRLDKEAFEEIMLARPSIAEEMLQILVERRAQLDSAMQSFGKESRNKEIHNQNSEILATVKRFFGL